jgi:hypothetical protein
VLGLFGNIFTARISHFCGCEHPYHIIPDGTLVAVRQRQYPYILGATVVLATIPRLVS